MAEFLNLPNKEGQDNQNQILQQIANTLGVTTDALSSAVNLANQSATKAENKIVDVENRFQTLTTEQQQDAEVIDARQGKTSLVANIQEFKDEFAAHKAEIASDIINLNNNKVDKDGSGQITYANLAQDVREQFTGGNTPIVGDNSIITSNLTNKAVTAEKTDFIYRSPNLFDKTTIVENTTIGDDGSLIASSTRVTSDFIPVEGSTYYVGSQDRENYVLLQRYNADKLAEGSISDITTGSVRMNSTTKFVRISINKNEYQDFQFEKGENPTPFKEYGKYYIDDFYIDSGFEELKGEIEENEAEFIQHKLDYAKQSEYPIYNLFKNSNLIDKSNYIWIQGCIFDVINNEFVVRQFGSGHGQIWQNIDTIIGDKYYVKVDMLSDNDNDSIYISSIYWSNYEFEQYKHSGSGQFEKLSLIFTAINNTTSIRLLETIENRQPSGIDVRIKKPLCINLTELYGKGNEPSIEEFEEKISKFPNYWIEEKANLVTFKELVDDVDAIERKIAELENTETGELLSPIKPHTPLDFYPITSESEAVTRLARSFDGNIYGVYKGTGNTCLFRSTDSGETIEEGFETRFLPPGDGIVSMNVFKDGTVVIATAKGHLVHLESFDAEDFTLAKDTDGAGFANFSVNAYEDNEKKIVIAGEYSHTNFAKNLWLSQDGGLTYSLLKVGDTLNSGNNHWHAVAYDTYSDGIWAAQGDGPNARIYYTPDYGTTWQYVEGYQPTLIYPMPDRVIFGEDSSSKLAGFYVWKRSDDGFVDVDEGVIFADTGAHNYYPVNTNWHTENPDEYYMNFPPRGADTTNNYLYATGDGGKNWYLVLNDTMQLNGLTGKDKNGYLFMIRKQRLMRAKAFIWY